MNTTSNSSMINWIKKNYDDLGEKCQQSYDINNQSILRHFAHEVPKRLKIQAQQSYNNILKELGLVEKKDSNGNLVLMNNLPIKTKMSKKETNSLISRLKENKNNITK